MSGVAVSDFWIGVLGNLVASALIGVPAYLWKIAPHLKAQRQHRWDVADWIEGIHQRLDAAGVPNAGEAPGRHATDTDTSVMPTVGGE